MRGWLSQPCPVRVYPLATVYPLGGCVIQGEAVFCSWGLISVWNRVACPQRLTFLAAGGQAHWLKWRDLRAPSMYISTLPDLLRSNWALKQCVPPRKSSRILVPWEIYKKSEIADFSVCISSITSPSEWCLQFDQCLIGIYPLYEWINEMNQWMNQWNQMKTCWDISVSIGPLMISSHGCCRNLSAHCESSCCP